MLEHGIYLSIILKLLKSLGALLLDVDENNLIFTWALQWLLCVLSCFHRELKVPPSTAHRLGLLHPSCPQVPAAQFFLQYLQSYFPNKEP